VVEFVNTVADWGGPDLIRPGHSTDKIAYLKDFTQIRDRIYEKKLLGTVPKQMLQLFEKTFGANAHRKPYIVARLCSCRGF
jgi:hypothetical protein